uniref:Uncharacterized protein n=1 Tax=Triticum urartu TaxID=4572 RepID=A0A8R7NY09_TRIUA
MGADTCCLCTMVTSRISCAPQPSPSRHRRSRSKDAEAVQDRHTHTLVGAGPRRRDSQGLWELDWL